jgi:glycosyltransferase involved in cell wall biosynthesis
VWTCYDVIPLVYPKYFSAAQRAIYRLTHWLAAQTAQVVLAISEATKADLIRFFRLNPRKIVVTPLAADPHFQPQPPAAIAGVQAQYALPEQYLLYFGSNKPHKNIVRLVEAFQLGSQLGAKAHSVLVVAGHWDNRYPEAKQLVEKTGWQAQVKFIGPVAETDLPALYSGATAFVFPSLYEGFGLPVLEAMACGTPVVCSNSSSLPEVAGEAHLSFDPLNIETMAAVIQEVLVSPALREELHRKSLQRAAQFSWRQTAQHTAAVYQQLLS